MSSLLKVTDLGKTFGAGKVATQVQRGLALELKHDELAALLGPLVRGKVRFL